MTQHISGRRNELDWLRVLAFILLIFYHIGMFYVEGWDWHVKSQYQSDWLQFPMILVNQWRMPLIFFVSGSVLALVETKIGRLRLLRVRFLRVFVPLVIGMYLVVPPQLYFQAIQSEGLGLNYWDFLLEYWNPLTHILPSHRHSDLGLLTWNHLWYLAYLWHYTLLYLLLRSPLQALSAKLANIKVSRLTLFLLPTVLLTAYGLFLKPYFPRTHGLTDDWYNHALSFTVFIFGYLAAKSPSLWQAIVQGRRAWLLMAMTCYTCLMVINMTTWFEIGDTWLISTVVQLIVYANVSAWLLTVVGFATYYLNREHKVLTYLNEAILPWYIFHQTITIVIAMQLSKLSLGGLLESTLLILGTFLGCAILYDITRRFKVTRFMFGMKLVS